MRTDDCLPLLRHQTAYRIALGLLLTAPILVWLGQYTDLDLRLADASFDAARQVFPLRHAWLTETFNHGILKLLLTLAALGWIGRSLLDGLGWWRLPSALARQRVRVVASSAILVPLVISSLKQASASHCPWDLARYAGTAPYVRLLDQVPALLERGHCLPAGHASSALWLIALAVLWLPGKPATAARVAVAGLALGLASGWMQQLRGAHFLTHTLWSMWLSCGTVLVVLLVVQWRTASKLQQHHGSPSFKQKASKHVQHDTAT